MPCATSAAAPSPCTFAGATTTWISPKRRPMTRSMSCRAAPLGEVTMPILRGKRGSPRLRAGSNNPSRPRRSLELLEGELQRAEPRGSSNSTTSLVFAALGVDLDGAEGSTCRPSAGSKRTRRTRLRNSTAAAALPRP